MNNHPVGIVLLNMGGPDTLEDVPQFLYNLFSDRDIIKLGPSFLQKPLARLISRRRAAKSQSIYKKIGGGSPLRKISEQQAARLERELSADGKFIVRVAMRYWAPSCEEALTELADNGVAKIIALPLYPHYTKATSGSSINDLIATHKRCMPQIPLEIVRSWPEEPGYLDVLAQRISATAEEFKGEPFELVYSAHSLPVSFIKEGDPYVDELAKTITGIEERLQLKGTLCYQSRSGPVEWLSPETSETIDRLAANGCTNILMVPISFVSDHVETLYEIDMLFKDHAAELGVRLISTPSLNSDPAFISSLRSIILRQLKNN
ncbi:ferrochelatase [Desulfosediminicola sp.]|uniref:ferrochelatase n=1 Tax=Desulfosediminicola sp. TaxID=2886825 RepID=UPI003AF2422F